MEFINWHGHTDASNHNNRDSIIKVEQMIDVALELGHSGVAITDHAVVSNHVKAILYLKKLKREVNEKLKKNPNSEWLRNRKEQLDNFKLGLGCEIYLVNKEETDVARENNEPTKFYHLVVLAKDLKGYRQLVKISSQGWENSFHQRGMERTPVYKEDIKDIIDNDKGHLIVTSACLGSEFATYILNFLDAKKMQLPKQMDLYMNKILSYMEYMKEMFGEDFYIELQPAFGDEQIEYNMFALEIAKYYNIKAIIATDAHYHRPEYKRTHTDFLKSQNAERETESFYSSTFMMSVAEMREYFTYFDDVDFEWLINNTMDIGSKIEEIDLYKPTQVPDATIEYDERFNGYFKYIKSLCLNFPYIHKYLTSPYLIDRIILQQIEKGMEEKGQKYEKENLERINRELESMWFVSEGLGERLSSYYVLTKEIVDLIWTVSLVGVSRGSAGAFYCSYLLGICQINPIEYDLPDWRHLEKSKIELADIDIDSESAQRANILELVKQKYGHRKVLSIATFKREGTPSAIQTICRGMGIDINDAKYLSSIIPREGVNAKSIQYCLDHYGEDEKCTRFINELKAVDEVHAGFIENIQRIEGLICGKSSHASGVYIFKEDYTEVNAMMKTPSGLPITQYDMLDSDYQSGLKLDFLTIEALDRIRKCIELLLKDGEIEWQGDLRSTYNKYLHPDVIEMKNENMFKMLRDGKILDAFQYDSVAGVETISKIQPNNFRELMDGNALMRLNPKEVELPINVYVRHKKDINIWYEDMKNYGLTEHEMEVLKSHLLKSYGVAPTQESIMKLSMDESISGFDLILANKLRKTVAKAYARHMADEVHQLMVEKGIEKGNREVFINYVWERFVVPQLKYSFSDPHLAGYTLILMQELNLATKYPTLYWNVACLSVQAGNISDEVNKGTDYGAIAKAIAGMEKGFVITPDINKAGMEFLPLKESNKAIYSLNAVNGIGEDVARAIIENRPYNTFDDFLTKCVETKLVTPSKVYTLIKAGCFDSIEPDRQKLMVDYVMYTTEKKEKLTTANIPKILEYGLLPEKYQAFGTLYQFRKLVFSKANLTEQINKSTGLYQIPANLLEYYYVNYHSCFEDAFEINLNGKESLNNKIFDKIYKEQIQPLTEWLATEDAIDKYNNFTRGINWNKYCSGSKEKWEMESICFYTDKHELDLIPLENSINIKNFCDLPREPEVVSTRKWRGRDIHEFRVDVIAGTVVEKNKNKSIITIATQSGDVVDIKLDKGRFSHYDRTTDQEKSWLTKGNKLLVVGYRRGETFYPKVYRQNLYQHSIMKIEGYDFENDIPVIKLDRLTIE
ncbi:PHP domain-containing protein [Romboutsia sp.]|uniref:PHP domain-containing protein n=1 Tax=Romboutsia sp. TaxID=1965302 RepID=UPI002C0B5364|nr:PHP domain-containing protein [Romboutsia sp.]HSQ89772.1 PHP domain-containing protein [Romboutsia sp.]